MNRENLTDLATFAVIVAALALFALTGCGHSGVRIVASSSTYTNLAEINYDEYKWPVFSFISGPKVTVWVNREYGELRSVTASGSVTNTTSALALYNSTEQKNVDLGVTFGPSNTSNAVNTVTGDAQGVTNAPAALAPATVETPAATNATESAGSATNAPATATSATNATSAVSATNTISTTQLQDDTPIFISFRGSRKCPI